MTRAALVAPARVKSAACYTTNIHCSRKPVRDERCPAQNRDQDQRVQQKLSQSLRLSTAPAVISQTAFIPFAEAAVKRDSTVGSA